MSRNADTGLILIRAAVRLTGIGEPDEAVGRVFYFGDGEHAVFGTITSIGYSDQEGVILYVSPRRYRGMDIHRLRYKEGTWYATNPDATDAQVGTLVML
jgi:hypothetical protein